MGQVIDLQAERARRRPRLTLADQTVMLWSATVESAAAITLLATSLIAGGLIL